MQTDQRLPDAGAFAASTWALCAVLIGANLPTPLYSLWKVRWGFSTGMLTVIFATYVVGTIIALVLVGRLSDRIGRRRVMLPALGLALLAAILFWTAQGVIWLIGARAVQGLAPLVQRRPYSVFEESEEAMMDSQLWTWDAVALATEIKKGQISSREAVESCLGRLEEVNPAINGVTVVLAHEALAAADEADRKVRAQEPLGPLHGVPITTKENVDQTGAATTSGVAAFVDLVAKTDSPQVANLRRAGAIFLGRSNTSAFAMRWHTDNELRGATRNPWSRAHTPGGSSGGAAASVAVGITPIALGNDYGGSIRWPAYCCGVAGLRPTLGRVPGHNDTAASERSLSGQLFSVQGPLARSVRDLRLGLRAMSQRDARDPWWTPAPLAGVVVKRPIRVAMTVDPSGEGVAPEVAMAVRRAGAALEHAGYVVEEVEPPSVAEARDLWWRLAWTEVRHTLAPAIGRYGDEGIQHTLGLYLAATPELGLSDYMRDVAARATCLREWLLFLERYPVVVGPVSTEPPFLADFETGPEATAERLKTAFRLLVAVNLLGLPSVAVPTGKNGGVPTGVQVIGSRYREDLCLDAAEAIEAKFGAITPIDVARAR